MVLYFVACWWEIRDGLCQGGRYFNNMYPGEQVFWWDVVCRHSTRAHVCYFWENRINLLSFRQKQRFDIPYLFFICPSILCSNVARDEQTYKQPWSLSWLNSRLHMLQQNLSQNILTLCRFTSCFRKLTGNSAIW